MSILKVDYFVATFLRFITRWYLQLKFVSKTFWTKIPKSNHCATVNYDTKKGKKIITQLWHLGPPSKEIDVIYKGVKELHHYTEMRFTSFSSGRFITITIVNPP